MSFMAFILAGFIAQASTPVDTGYRDFSYPSGTGGSNNRVTGEKPESKAWYNDGRWNASLWSSTHTAYTIHWLDLTTQSWIDTGTQLDSRNDSKADVLWDETQQKLYVVSHAFADTGSSTSTDSEKGKLFRYTYDAVTKSYSLDSSFSGGVNVNDSIGETLVLTQDSTDRLWVTYVEDKDVMVNYSNASGGGDTDWGTPFVLPTSNATGLKSDDISTIVSYNGRVGIMWSNQNTSPITMNFAVHADDDTPTTSWQHVVAHGTTGDDHINLKSLQTGAAGEIYAVVKSDGSTPIIILLACTDVPCTSAGDWSAHGVYDNGDKPTRPILLIDEENRDLYVVIGSRDLDNIYYKKTDMDNISFTISDTGTPMIESDDDEINDPTSTKQNLNSETGLVVLAGSHTAGFDNEFFYFHNCIPLDGSSECFAPAATPTVTVSLVGTGNADVKLDWDSSHSDANCSYEVYRETLPYLDIDGDGLTAVATITTTPWEHTITGDAGNPATNHFYIVRALNCNPTTPNTADSSELGEFDFTVEPGDL